MAPSITSASPQPTLNKVTSMAQKRVLHLGLHHAVLIAQAQVQDMDLLSTDPALPDPELMPLWCERSG